MKIMTPVPRKVRFVGIGHSSEQVRILYSLLTPEEEAELNQLWLAESRNAGDDDDIPDQDNVF